MTDVPVELIEKMKKLSESGFEISFKLHRHSRAKLAYAFAQSISQCFEIGARQYVSIVLYCLCMCTYTYYVLTSNYCTVPGLFLNAVVNDTYTYIRNRSYYRKEPEPNRR